MYTIKFRNRYLDWCDDRWYGTKKDPMFKFTLAECNFVIALVLFKPLRALMEKLYRKVR